MARVLILRQGTRAAGTAEELRAAGHVPLVLPLQETTDLLTPPPAGPFAGLIATSVNAVPALAAHFALAGLPLQAVGEATAAAAVRAGFAVVSRGEGTGASLAGPASDLAARSGLPLLYAAGQQRSGGLEAALLGAGVPFKLWEVYTTRGIAPEPEALKRLLAEGGPDAVLLLSAGQAAAFSALLAGSAPTFDPVPRLLCISGRVAGCLPPALRNHAAISPAPTLSSLFDLLA